MTRHGILAARLKVRLDAMIERDGSTAAAITGPGVGIGYLFARDLHRALEAAERMREALTKIAAGRDCGCRPCTGDCTNRDALLAEADGLRDIALAALTPTDLLEQIEESQP